MSTFIKLVISFIILLLIAILISFILFYSKIDIGVIKFFNTHLEDKYQKEINKIGEKIDKYFNQIEVDLKEGVQKFDFSKFIDKAKSKNFDLLNEDSLIKQLTLKYNDLYCVKFFDLSKNLLYSSLEKERIISKNIVSFFSLDKIEEVKNIYANTSDPQFTFIFFNEFVIFKKGILYNNKFIGIILFYFKDSFLLNILLQNEYFKYQSINFINDSLIFINKPEEISLEELNKLKIENSTQMIVTNIRNSSGENVVKSYKTFKYKFKRFNIFLLRLVDNNIFVIDKRKSTILVFLFFFTFYTFIFLILSFKKSDFDKAKEKISLFSTMLLEEIINSRTKEEIERLKTQLGQRKKIILTNIYTDFKKLTESNKKNLEEQLDIILKKIEEAMIRNLETIQNMGTIQKIEQLFEKLIATITEKGIVLNYNPNTKISKTNQIPNYSLNKAQIKSVQDVEEIEEVEEVQDVEEIGEVEEVEEVQDVEEIEEVEEVEEVQDVEEIEEVEEVEKEETKEHDGLEDYSKKNIQKDLALEEKKEYLNSIELLSNAEEFNMEIFSEENNLILKRKPLFNSSNDDIVIYEISNESFNNKIEEDEESYFDNEYYEESLDINSFPSLEKFEQIDTLKNTEKIEEFKNYTEIQKQEGGKINNIEDLFDIKKEDLKENRLLGEQEENIEEIETVDEEVPTIPDYFYETVKKPEDELSKEIANLESKKTPLQELIENIYDKMGVSKLSLFISSININRFIQSYQIGFKENKVESYTIDTNNILVQHIFQNERLVYVADMNKIKFIFENNEDIYNEYNDMKSLLIYPFKIFGKIRALIFLAFKDDRKDQLESIIEILENNKNDIIKNILKLI